MIDQSRVFAITHSDKGKASFVRPLPEVVAHHMRTSAKLFRPSTLIEDFGERCKVDVTRQAINSALTSLIKQRLVRKDGRGVYRHLFHS